MRFKLEVGISSPALCSLFIEGTVTQGLYVHLDI